MFLYVYVSVVTHYQTSANSRDMIEIIQQCFSVVGTIKKIQGNQNVLQNEL